MALKLEAHQHRYIGLSSDPKPASGVPYGSTVFETDTKRLMVYDGNGWVDKALESQTDLLLASMLQVLYETKEFTELIAEKL